MPVRVPKNLLLKRLEKDGFCMTPELRTHEEICPRGVPTCTAVYLTQFFLFMTSPVAIKLFNEKFEANVPEYTNQELETAWSRAKEIFQSTQGLDEFKTWEDLIEHVPNLSDDSIKAMVRAGHLVKGYFRNEDHVKIAVLGHLHPQMKVSRTIGAIMNPTRFLNEAALDCRYDKDRNKAILYLSGNDFEDIAGIRLAGLAMFRDLVLSGKSWNIYDPSMFGRPELALFLYKALDSTRTQCLYEPESLDAIQEAIRNARTFMPENMKQDLKTPLFDKFGVFLDETVEKVDETTEKVDETAEKVV